VPEQNPEPPPLQPTHEQLELDPHWAHEAYLSDPVQTTCCPPLLLLLVLTPPSSPVEPSGTYESWGP
jgi:hypothetical protein